MSADKSGSANEARNFERNFKWKKHVTLKINRLLKKMRNRGANRVKLAEIPLAKISLASKKPKFPTSARAQAKRALREIKRTFAKQAAIKQESRKLSARKTAFPICRTKFTFRSSPIIRLVKSKDPVSTVITVGITQSNTEEHSG